jgi:hypothetical protein
MTLVYAIIKNYDKKNSKNGKLVKYWIKNNWGTMSLEKKLKVNKSSNLKTRCQRYDII